jgi:hypothetical protein
MTYIFQITGFATKLLSINEEKINDFLLNTNLPSFQFKDKIIEIQSCGIVDIREKINGPLVISSKIHEYEKFLYLIEKKLFFSDLIFVIYLKENNKSLTPSNYNNKIIMNRYNLFNISVKIFPDIDEKSIQISNLSLSTYNNKNNVNEILGYFLKL